MLLCPAYDRGIVAVKKAGGPRSSTGIRATDMHRRTLFKASAAAIASALSAPAIAQGDAKVLRCAPEANLASIDPI